MPSPPGSPSEHDFPRPPTGRQPIAFCANLNAEDELRQPGHQPKRARLVHLRERAGTLVPSLLRTDDRVLFTWERGQLATGLAGECWCVTPAAIACLARAGARLPPHPAFDVVSAVNHRAFGVSPDDVVHGHLVTDLHALIRRLDSEPDAGLGFVAKPAFGFAGRGHRRLGRTLSEDDRRHLQRPLAQGGVLLEPWLARELDCALHGYITRDGRVRLGTPTIQHCDARGAWLGSQPEGGGALRPNERRLLLDAGEQTAERLQLAGYFGPFGIDAFRFVTAGGARGFRPRVEINARYTMAWGTGFFAG